MRRGLVFVGFALVCDPLPCVAQESPPADEDTRVEGRLSNVTRVEAWRFFEPPPSAVDPHYTFFGNRSDLGLRVRAPRFDLTGAFAYVRVERLPTDAIGPGGLGTGAFYFAASGLPYSYQVYLTELTVSAHSRNRRLRFTLGRMPYTSGAEGERDDASAATPHFANVRRLGLDGRLLGSFDWSFYGRRFDGIKLDWSGSRAYAGGGAFLVSQGVFEESTNLTMTKLGVGTTYAGYRHGPRAESQVFGNAYRDHRAIDVRPDNANQPVTAADIRVFSAGASHVGTREWGAGEGDWLAWGAWQGGDWYGQRHRAYSGAAQAGYRWPARSWEPWVRAGVSYASGDDDPRDDRHETFFPMLPEMRTYALSMVYAQMNLRDMFVQVLARPHDRARLRMDVHRLDLARAADRWYQGSGATAREGRFFGYSTRPSAGTHTLGTIVEGTADVRIARHWSLNGYVGRMWGGRVVRASFAGDKLFYWYVENVLSVTLPRP